MDTAAEKGRNPVSEHQIQPEYGDEQADAGRDCRTRLAKPNSQAPTGTTSKIGNLTRLTLLLLYVMIIHTLGLQKTPTKTRFVLIQTLAPVRKENP